MEANPHLGASENFTLMLSTKARQGRQRKLRPNGQDGPLVQSSSLIVKDFESSDFLQTLLTSLHTAEMPTIMSNHYLHVP